MPSMRGSSTNSGSVNPGSSASTVHSIDMPFCTLDTSRVDEEDRSRVSPSAIQQIVDKIGTSEGGRHCVVTKVPRNESRMRIICATETEREEVEQIVQRQDIREKPPGPDLPGQGRRSETRRHSRRQWQNLTYDSEGAGRENWSEHR